MTGDSRAVLTRPAPPPDHVLVYGDHPDHVADLRLPRPGGRSAAAGTLVLFLHGGFWRDEYDRQHAGHLARDLADRGYVVACPEFRRTGAPGGGWPGTFDDVQAAVTAVPGLVRSHAEIDTLVLAGHSAGGQLALWAAGRLVAAGTEVRGVLALSPVCDLAEAYRLDLDRGAVADLLGGGPDEVPDRYAAVDPIALLPLGVPVRLLHGMTDGTVPVAFSRRYQAAARLAGDRVALTELPDTGHFPVIDPRSEVWPTVLAELQAVASA